MYTIRVSKTTIKKDDMMTENINAVETAIKVGVIEMLVQPEYNNYWIKEILETAGLNPENEKLQDEVATAIDFALLQLAKPVIRSLSGQDRSNYNRYLD